MLKLTANRIDKLYEKYKENYRVEISKRNNKVELWKKNKRYGYYNFIDYIKDNNIDSIKERVVKDIIKEKENEESK